MIRWFAVAAFIGCMSVSVYHRRRARLESETIPRRREGARLAAGRGLVAIPLFLAILAYLVNPRWLSWTALATPAWSRWLGVALGLVAVPASYWVFRHLGRNVSETVLTKRDHQLVTSGPYRWVRHPLYTTGMVLCLGIGLMAASWLILLFSLIALAAIRFVVVPREEAELIAKFGDRYRAYRQRTGALFPRVSRSG